MQVFRLAVMASLLILSVSPVAYAQEADTQAGNNPAHQFDDSEKPNLNHDNQTSFSGLNAEASNPQSADAQTGTTDDSRAAQKSLTDDIDGFFDGVEDDARKGDLDLGCSLPDYIS